jgi:hypothetical protein
VALIERSRECGSADVAESRLKLRLSCRRCWPLWTSALGCQSPLSPPTPDVSYSGAWPPLPMLPMLPLLF